MGKGHKSTFSKEDVGNSLAVQWLGLGAFSAGTQVRSLVGELKSHKPHSVAKKKKRHTNG